MQLLKLRTQKKWSQEFVSRRLEVSRQTISNWESGKSVPNLDHAYKIAKLFGVSVDELMETHDED